MWSSNSCLLIGGLGAIPCLCSLPHSHACCLPGRCSERASVGAATKALAWARRRRQCWMAVCPDGFCQNLQTAFRARPNEIGILTNGIEITKPPSEAETKALRREVRHELGLPAGARMLLTTARLDPSKGHADLLAIIPMVIDKFPDAIFVWAGDRGNREDLEVQVQRLGLQRHVRFLGYRTDVERLLRASDLFVFPSHSKRRRMLISLSERPW